VSDTPTPKINGVTIPRAVWRRIVDTVIPGTDQPEAAKSGKSRSANLKRLCRLDKAVRQRVRDLAVEFLREQCVLAKEPSEPDWVARLAQWKADCEPTPAPAIPIPPENAPEPKAGSPAPSTDHRPPISQASAESQIPPQTESSTYRRSKTAPFRSDRPRPLPNVSACPLRLRQVSPPSLNQQL